MCARSSRMLQALLALTCASCGRIGLEYGERTELRDAAVDAPATDGSSPVDSGLDGASDASDLWDGSDLDALAPSDALALPESGNDAAPADAAQTSDAAPGDCRLTVGGRVVQYRSGEVGVLEGGHRFTLVQSGLCAAPAGCSTDHGGNVAQASCDSSTCQLWESFDAGDGWFSLRNGMNGACLYMQGTADGTNAITWECINSDRVRWRAVCATNNAWSLISKFSNKPLQGDGQTTPGAGIDQATQTDSTQQQWTISSHAMPFAAVAPTAERDSNQIWRYTTASPSPTWMQPSFDDSAWTTGPAAFGDGDRGFTLVRTAWTSSDLWLRRSFSLTSIPASLSLRIFHDESVEVYLNGALAFTLSGWSQGYRTLELPAAIRGSLVVGSNSIAVHCHNGSIPQFLDLGLYTYSWP